MALGGSNSTVSGRATGLHEPMTTSKGMAAARVWASPDPTESSAKRATGLGAGLAGRGGPAHRPAPPTCRADLGQQRRVGPPRSP